MKKSIRKSPQRESEQPTNFTDYYGYNGELKDFSGGEGRRDSNHFLL
jgi:hypothetical protein